MERKLFNAKTKSLKQIRKDICRHAKHLGVYKVVFNNKARRVSGTYNACRKIIFLDTKLTKKQLIRTYCHELGHHIACKQQLWIDYHFGLKSLQFETCFLIENNIDKIAAQIWNIYVCKKAWGSYSFFYPYCKKKNMSKWVKF
jgi:hypothetical protein